MSTSKKDDLIELIKSNENNVGNLIKILIESDDGTIFTEQLCQKLIEFYNIFLKLEQHEQEFINSKAKELKDSDEKIFENKQYFGNNMLNNLMKLQIYSLLIYIKNTFPQCKETIDKIIVPLTQKIGSLTDIQEKIASSNIQSTPSILFTQQQLQPSLESQQQLQQQLQPTPTPPTPPSTQQIQISLSQQPSTQPSTQPLQPSTIPTTIEELDILSKSIPTNQAINIQQTVGAENIEAVAKQSYENIKENEQSSTNLISDFKNFNQRGGGEFIGKYINLVDVLSDFYKIYNTDLMLRIVTIISYPTKFQELCKIIGEDKKINKTANTISDEILNIFFTKIDGSVVEIIKILINKKVIDIGRIDIDNKIYYNLINNGQNNGIFIFTYNLFNALSKAMEDLNIYSNFFSGIEIAGQLNILIYNNCLRKIMSLMSGKENSYYGLFEKKKEFILQKYNECLTENKKIFSYLRIRNDNTNAIIQQNPRYAYEINAQNFNKGYFYLGYLNCESDNNNVLSNCSNNKEYYYFGPYDDIFETNINNKEIAKKIYNDISDRLLIKKQDICVISYGQSGSGKTSSLIYLNTKDNMTGQDIKTDGVLVELCNNADFINVVTNIEVKMVNIYARHGVDINYIKRQFNKNVYDVTDILPAEFKIINIGGILKWYNSTNNKNLGEYIIDIFNDPQYRQIEPTPNNPESSRSHMIVDMVLTINGTNEPRHIIICDFAGVENKFDCGDSNEIQKFEESYKLNKKYEDPIKIKFNDYFDMQTQSTEHLINQSIIDRQQYNVNILEYKKTLISQINYVIEMHNYLQTINKIENLPVLKNINILLTTQPQNEQQFACESNMTKLNNNNAYKIIQQIYNINDIIKYINENIINSINKIKTDSNIINAINNFEFQLALQLENWLVDNYQIKWDDVINLMIKINKSLQRDTIGLTKLYNMTDSNQIKIVQSYNNGNTSPFDYFKNSTKTEQFKNLFDEYDGVLYPKKNINFIFNFNAGGQLFNNFKSLASNYRLYILKPLFKDLLRQFNFCVCRFIKLSQITYNCKIRNNEGLFINHVLSDIRRDVRRFIISTVKQNTTKNIVPVFFDKLPHPYCVNTNINDNVYDTFYEASTNTIYDQNIIFDIFKDKLKIDIKNLNFIIYTLINLTNNNKTNNPPNPPYTNIKHFIYLNNIKKPYNQESVAREFNLVFGNNNYYKNDQNFIALVISIQSQASPINFKNEVNKLIDYVNINNSVTLIGSLESTDQIQNITYDKVVCSFDNDLKNILTKYSPFNINQNYPQVANKDNNEIEELNDIIDGIFKSFKDRVNNPKTTI